MRPASTPLVELEGVSFRYPSLNRRDGSDVVHDFGLQISGGEFVSLAGRSGSGKTTVLHIVGGLLEPSAGTVRWLGEATRSLSDSAASARRGQVFGIVLQGGGLIDSLTAAENVLLPRSAHVAGATASRDRATLLLERVGLAGLGDRFPSQLSGGEQQRVGIARALFAEPALLVADEPTANLDRATADQIVALFRTLHERGQTVLVATHDEHLIEASHRVIRLR
jgi:putative ABC transport system ATP-binding protein